MAVLEDADHNLLRYACCWEDADLLLQGLGKLNGAKVLSIGSAGDNSFSLLASDAAQVLCLDVNPVQLALVRLKQAAFSQLEYEEFLKFLGFRAGRPLDFWPKVSKGLSDSDAEFWSVRSEQIADGIIRQGKFERYLLLFQKKVLPYLHSRAEVAQLFAVKDTASQKRFYDKRWNNWAWSLFTRFFFSRWFMGRFGRDPVFLKQVKGNVGHKIKKKINAHLQSVHCQPNYFLKFMLQGEFGEELPHYAREENFGVIKSNLHRLEFYQGPLQDLPAKQGFTHANLSNIFEYQSMEEFEFNALQLERLLEPGGLLAYWNLMVVRDLAEQFPESFESGSKQELKEDYGFFYQSFHLQRRR